MGSDIQLGKKDSNQLKIAHGGLEERLRELGPHDFVKEVSTALRSSGVKVEDGLLKDLIPNTDVSQKGRKVPEFLPEMDTTSLLKLNDVVLSQLSQGSGVGSNVESSDIVRRLGVSVVRHMVGLHQESVVKLFTERVKKVVERVHEWSSVSSKGFPAGFDPKRDLKWDPDLEIIPENGNPDGAIEKTLNLAVAHARRHGPLSQRHLISTPNNMAITGALWSLATSENPVTLEVSPFSTRLELGLAEEFVSQVGFDPKKSFGALTHSGSESDGQIMMIMRNRAISKFMQENSIVSPEGNSLSVIDFNRKYGGRENPGKGEFKEMVVFATRETHYWFRRKIKELGMGDKNIIVIKNDERGRMDIDDFREKYKKSKEEGNLSIGVVATFGTTNSGALDPIKEIREITGPDEFIGVDGAYGLGIMYTTDPLVSEKVKDVGRYADAFSFDPHKLWGVPYSASFIGFKRSSDLQFMEDLQASYLNLEKKDDQEFHIDHTARTKYLMTASRPDMATKLFVMLQAMGRTGMNSLLNAQIASARLTAELIKEDPKYNGGRTQFNNKIELLREPDLTTVNYRVIPNDLKEEAGRRGIDINELANRLTYRIEEMSRRSGLSPFSKTKLSNTDKTGEKETLTLLTIYTDPHTSEQTIRKTLDHAQILGSQIWTDMKRDYTETRI